MRRAIRGRLRILSLGIFLVALLLVTRLYFVQVVHGADFSLRAERQYISASQELYDRGSIYFTRKDGTVLSAATLSNGFTIAMNPKQLIDPEAAYAKISSLIAVDHDEFFGSAARKEDPYEVVAKRVEEDAGAAIEALDIPGIQVERERWRSYPGETCAAQSIGFVAFDDDDSLAGRFGLERYYNDVLSRGSVGLFGNFFAELFANIDSVVVDARETREGDLVTTIEPMVQEKLDQVLAEVNAQYGSRETGGIIMDPKTGEILALDTAPSFDANDFANGDSDHFGNPLVEHRYEFGSIVKALTMTAGLDSGVVSTDSVYNDTGCTTLNN
ncbi:MAG: penicillin-binding transpeptidase domain-containing protein, partial [Undibacterium sp.]